MNATKMFKVKPDLPKFRQNNFKGEFYRIRSFRLHVPFHRLPIKSTMPSFSE